MTGSTDLLVVEAAADLDQLWASDRLGRLADGWMLGYGSPHTRRAYAPRPRRLGRLVL